MEDINAQIVASKNRKHHHEVQNVVLFFSLIIGLPAAVFILVWISVRGAFPYIRSHINDSDNFPMVAAFYWIGLTFTFFVIVMDVTALAKNGAFGKRDSLQLYQLIFILLITIFEIFGLFLSFILALIPLCSHAKNLKFKSCFRCYYAILCCGMSFKQIDRKEARAWLFVSSLITPIMALSSHAGFIIGGWVSYRDRSIAIFLLYLILFVFLYWSLQYLYRFSTAFVNHTIRKHQKIDSIVHYEEGLSSNWRTIKEIGFDSIALFFMLLLLIGLYGVLFYFCLGLVLPLLSSIDEALVHIFSLGKYAIVITVFLLTYKVFSTGGGGGGIQRLVSNEALKYWKFLNSGYQKKTHIAALQLAIKRLDLTLEVCNKDREVHKDLLNRKKFDIKMVFSHLEKALNYVPRPVQANIMSFRGGAEELKNSIDNDRRVTLETFENGIQQLKDWIKNQSVDPSLEDDEMLMQGVSELCAGINHFQKTLVSVLGVPPMYLNRDKANALTAALIYQKVSTSQLLRCEEGNPQQLTGQNQLSHPEDNERYSLLLSLIEEDF